MLQQHSEHHIPLLTLGLGTANDKHVMCRIQGDFRGLQDWIQVLQALQDWILGYFRRLHDWIQGYFSGLQDWIQG